MMPTMRQIEETAIRERLEACNWDVCEAARSLRVGKTSVYRKMKHYGIPTPKRTMKPRVDNGYIGSAAR